MFVSMIHISAENIVTLNFSDSISSISLGATNSNALLLHYFALISGEAPPRGQKISLV